MLLHGFLKTRGPIVGEERVKRAQKRNVYESVAKGRIRGISWERGRGALKGGGGLTSKRNYHGGLGSKGVWNIDRLRQGANWGTSKASNAKKRPSAR